MMMNNKTLILRSFSLHSCVSHKLDTKLLLTCATNRKNYSTKRLKSYSKELRAIYVNFTIALLHNKLNIDINKFNNYSSIINFLEKHKGEKLFTRHHVSKLKHTKEFKRIPLTSESLDFINYVKKTFPEFNGSLFVDEYIEVTTKTMLREEVPARANILSTTYHNDKKTKTAKHSLRSKYLWIIACWHTVYEKFNYLFIILPCFILLILAIKDNPELLDAHIKEWKTELNTITKTYNTDYTSWRTPAEHDMHPFGEQHMFENIDSWDQIHEGSVNPENSYPNITNSYSRIEEATVPTVDSKSTDTPVSSSLDLFEDIPSRWPSSTGYTQTKANTELEITNDYSDTVIDAATSDTYPTIKDITKAKSKSSWWLSMLDFNNLNYFPSLFDDLSKPKETYTVIQDISLYPKQDINQDIKLKNGNVSTYKRYIINSVNESYLKKAILQHEKFIKLENTTVLHNEANIITEKLSSTADEIRAKANIKANDAISKVNLIVSSNEAIDSKHTTENASFMQADSVACASKDMDITSNIQKTNTSSISYNLNRDSVSSTYSKYFYMEDSSTTDKVTTPSKQVHDKAVDNTQVKLFVSEHIDYTEDTNSNKNTYHTGNNIHHLDEQAKANKSSNSAISEPVTLTPQEQVSNTDVSNSLHTNIKNSKLLMEPLSPYSPSIITDYVAEGSASYDIQVPDIQVTAASTPHVDVVTPVESISTSLSQEESSRYSNDLSVPEVKPTKITAPLLDDDHDLPSAQANPYPSDQDHQVNADPVDTQANTETESINPEETSSLHTSPNPEHTDISDLYKAKNKLIENNNHIIDILRDLDTLQERVIKIDGKHTSLLNERAQLTNKLNNNNHNLESFTELTSNNDNPLYTTYKNAYNSFTQWGLNTASPVSSNDITSKLSEINNKLNSLQETKTDLMNNINNNNNSLENLNNHNIKLRQFIKENFIASP